MLSLSAIMISCAISMIAAGATAFHLVRTTTSRSPAMRAPDHDARFLFQGHDLLNASGGGEWLLETGQGKGESDWAQLRCVLSERFPEFPLQPEKMDADIVTFPASYTNDNAELLLERINDLTRVTLLEPDGNILQPADVHHRLMTDQRLEILETAMDSSPYPVWSTDDAGQITWANAAYHRLAENAEPLAQGTIPVLFSLPEFSPPASPRTRLSLTLKASDSNIWFDVTSIQTETRRTHYAIDINAVVQAEIAQRNFVQTLTKTFAQLSIGLVIFDRKRQLALFNPALIDLLHLPPDFLSGRPTLLSFFDRLRDHQIMPEPKDYRSWRDDMTDLVDAATDGRYLETWNLPSGLTYRVSGRPHPDGAIAFLFEDVSAEMTLTRRFRHQLEVLQNLIDGLPQPIAIFSSSNTLTFSNEAYRILWNCDPDSSFAKMTLEDSVRLWRSRCSAETMFDRVYPGMTEPLQITMTDGTRMICRLHPLNGGSFAVLFGSQDAETHLLPVQQIA